MNCEVIAEIGINHNGDLNIAKKLIDIASFSGCDYVKFQKRTPDVCVPEAQKNKIKQTPWGELTYLEYKHRLEFGKKEYEIIDSYCRSKKIGWFASVWDEDSVDFMKQFVGTIKIPSALITDLDLCKKAKNSSDVLMISTGMSTEQEIQDCVEHCQPKIIMHTNSSYPSNVNELNLKYIERLKRVYPSKTIGYSGHEYGLATTFAAVAMGSEVVERHITLDRTMWGSDHLSSVEPIGLMKLTKGISDICEAMGEDKPRVLSENEKVKKETLRG